MTAPLDEAVGNATDDDADTDTDRRRAPRSRLALRCILAGVLIAAAVPPWGWWPLAFVGIALLDRLIADQPWKVRFRRTWLVCAAWLYPSMLWMADLTPPGYVIACAAYAGYFGVTVALCPPGRWRWIALPGAFVLAEWARWAFPFGGVPLSTLAMSQADAPLAFTVRVAGALLLVALVVVAGVALSALLQRAWRPAAVALGVLALFAAGAAVAPRGHQVDTIDVAIVQGGGPQRTRAEDTDEREVFERHLEATADVDGPVDLVIWPENVINVEGNLSENREGTELADLARELDTTLIVGAVEGQDDHFLNAEIVYDRNGQVIDRYDKVKRVPFGEFVPLRGLLEKLNGELPARDAKAGTGPAVVDTPVGRIGVMISWETFFSTRGRDATGNGGRILLNPTNGSSYWLTQVQSQQITSSRLRALENDRWVLQAAPTGFSAIVTPDGTLVDRTSISERAVLQGNVGLREGSTIATRVGDAPVLLVSVALMALAWLLDGRARRRRSSVLAPDSGAIAPESGARTSRR